MAIISCPECGKQISDRAISCPDCGCPINTSPAESAQAAASKELEKLLLLARRAREAADSKNAKKYYDQILIKDPGNWEAIFYSVYFEASECKIIGISSAANSVANSIYSTFAAISDLTDEKEQDSALDTIISSAVAISLLFANGAISHYNNHSSVSGASTECGTRVVCAGNIYEEIENSLKKLFPNKKVKLANHQKNFATYLSKYSKWYNFSYRTNTLNRLANEIKQVDPSYQAQTTTTTNTSGGCYVATAVYGSYDCPQVWTLRRFRDNTLAATWFGRLFIYIYYAISPTIVKWFGDTQWFKKLWSTRLDKMVENLNSNGVDDTPYNDISWR